jgi:hypothetical protein
MVSKVDCVTETVAAIHKSFLPIFQSLIPLGRALSSNLPWLIVPYSTNGQIGHYSYLRLAMV